ncbi:MAG: peptidylprolyl isomerase [Phycisphaeraceae bacterium]|nr:peptidylprolyl isomerase [Phycisphaeraceae bacterium]
MKTPTILVSLAALAASAHAQLTPERLYYGKDRPVPMSVEVPAGATDAARVDVFVPGNPNPVDSASVTAGRVDLAALFSTLWSTQTPVVAYAQLMVGDEGVGPPVVIQPLLTPVTFRAPANPRLPPEVVPTGPRVYSGIRAYPDQHVVFETTLGDLEFRLRPDTAPNTAYSFRELADGGYYTDIIFHRIIGPKPGRAGFMAQVGDPIGVGNGGPGFVIDFEASTLPHDRGVISMARTSDPNSAGGQVFVCFSREGTNFLDSNYVAFGETVRGADTVAKLQAVEVQASPSGEVSSPVDPPRVVRAYLKDAPPYPNRPAPISQTGENPPR